MVDELKALNQMKDDLIKVCSHDLRSPLHSILGFADLLAKKDYIEAEDRQGLTRIRASGETLLNLINEILDLGNIQTG